MFRLFKQTNKKSSVVNYQDLPDHTRVWVYQSNRELTAAEVVEIQMKGDQFVSEWASHGTKLSAAIGIFYQRFIVVFVDEQQAMASGCSIDKSVAFIQQTEQAYNITLMDRMLISYKEGDEIKLERMPDFDKLVSDGVLNAKTIVFNNLVATKKEFEAQWEVPMEQSWHARMLA